MSNYSRVHAHIPKPVCLPVARLSAQDLDKLKAQNPAKNFIDIHQITKNGKFRGTNEYQHDVDIVIEVPERGKATQFGRFNQGGEISIFDQEEPLCDEGGFSDGGLKARNFT